MSNLTIDQENAVNANEGNFLVAAGAGSGKTKVLTQRVFRLLKERRAGLRNVLVLTFSDKAAGEMKKRVRDLLLSDPSTREMAEKIDEASIQTFDAFSRSLVEKYHYDLGLKGEIEIADEAFLDVTAKELLNEHLMDLCAKGDKEWLEMLDLFANKNDDDLQEEIISLYKMANLSLNKKAFFDDYEQNHFSSEAVEKSFGYFRDYLRNEISEEIQIIKREYSSTATALAETDITRLYNILEFSTFNEMAAVFDYNRIFVTLPKGGYEDRDKDVRARVKERFKVVRGWLQSKNQEDLIKQYLTLEPYVLRLVKLAQYVDEQMSIKKKEAGVYSFADIAELARQAALIPEVNAELKSTYKYIMVDEYQDTSDLQEGFINSIANNNVFEVGDIKQSIYLFRHANPTLFSQKYEAYKNGNGGTLFILKDNFRSRESVLGDINNIFTKAMSKSLGDVNYASDQALRFGAQYYSSTEDKENRHIENYVYLLNKGENVAKKSATIIANDIFTKIQNHYQLKTGPAQFGDFAILISKKKEFQTYRRVFEKAKIPLDITDQVNGGEENAVLLFKRIVKLIAILDKGDEEGERHCYASIARSYIYSLSDEEIYTNLQTGSYKTSPSFELVRKNLTSLRNMTMSDLTSWIIDTFGLLAHLDTLGQVKNNYEKLSSITSLAKLSDRFGYSIDDLLAYFANSDKYDEPLKVETPHSGSNSVHLLTIHASKGLEYPIVYLPGLDADLTKNEEKGSFLVNPEFGGFVPLLGAESGSKTYLQFLGSSLEKSKHLSEEMRLFYVALTRAEEKIIFLHKERDNDDLMGRSPKSFSDFLALSGYFSYHVFYPSSDYLLVYSGDEKKEIPVSSLTFKQINKFGKENESKRASKLSVLPLDPSKAQFGLELHSLLELVDFKSKDTSFIVDHHKRDLIDKVLKLPLFAHLEGAKIYKEYAYIDEDSDITGSIDCLIIYPTKAVIIDWKTKTLSDPNYLTQLDTYAKIVKSLFHLPIEKYLVSIIEGEVLSVQ
jgi:ATP-dependent helicase/nuclease subunit A